MGIFRQKILPFLAIFPPICISFGLFSTQLLKSRENSVFGTFKELFGYFLRDNLVALLSSQQMWQSGFRICNLKGNFITCSVILFTFPLIQIQCFHCGLNRCSCTKCLIKTVCTSISLAFRFQTYK